MAGEFDSDTIAKAYAGWARSTDLVFGAVFDAGRRASIAAAERIGGRISMWASEPAFRSPTIRAATASCVDYCEPMCARRSSASSATSFPISRRSP